MQVRHDIPGKVHRQAHVLAGCGNAGGECVSGLPGRANEKRLAKRLAVEVRVLDRGAVDPFGIEGRHLDVWLLGDERICFCEEPPGIEIEWRSLTGKSAFSTKIWNDAFLAAFAISSTLKLVTFDHGFRLYPALTLQTLV